MFLTFICFKKGLTFSAVTMRFQSELSCTPVPFYSAAQTLPWTLWNLGTVLEAGKKEEMLKHKAESLPKMMATTETDIFL